MSSGSVGQTAPPILASVSLQDVTIATVGTGVMAESMITGLLKAREVDPAHVVASHPRAERREHLARTSSCWASSPR